MTVILIIFFVLTTLCGVGAALFLSIIIESLHNEGE